jgi:quinol monooxygenase YgiN
MRDEIYWVVTCSVRPGKFEQFTGVVESLVTATKQETGSISYDYSVNDDKTLVQIFESYQNSRAPACSVVALI